MDSLPQEVIAQILLYLPGIDVARCKRANKAIRKTVDNYQEKLKSPEVKMAISNRDPDAYNHGQMIQMDFTFGKRHWGLVYEHPKHITLESWKDRHYFDFFGPFFDQKKRIEERTFETLLDFIFQKADIAEMDLTGMSNEECVTILADRIKANKPRILSIRTCPSNYSSLVVCSLMKTIAFQKRRTKTFPTTTVMESADQIAFLETNLRRINAMATLYKGTVMKTEIPRTSTVLRTIIETWSREPFDHFYFELHVKSCAPFAHPMPPFDVPGMHDEFKMIRRENMENFEHCIWDGRDSFFILQDRHHGHVIRIDKKGIIPPTRAAHIMNQPAGTVLISLGVTLNH